MTLAQLAYFIAVAETGSFTKGAAREHVAQPSLSQQIQALERELGGSLFERRSDGVRLTAAGRALLPKARAALQAARDGRFLASQALAGGPDALCIATLPGAPSALLAAAVAHVRDARPTLAVRIHAHPTQERVEEKLRDGEGALALAQPPSPESWNGPVVSLGVRELVLVTRLDDEHDGPVEAHELAKRPLVLLEPDEDLVLGALARAGVEPPALVRTDTVAGVLALVGAGAGVALLDESALDQHSGLRTRRLAEPPRREWALFASGEWTPPGLDVVAELVTLAGEPAGVT